MCCVTIRWRNLFSTSLIMTITSLVTGIELIYYPFQNRYICTHAYVYEYCFRSDELSSWSLKLLVNMYSGFYSTAPYHFQLPQYAIHLKNKRSYATITYFVERVCFPMYFSIFIVFSKLPYSIIISYPENLSTSVFDPHSTSQFSCVFSKSTSTRFFFTRKSTTMRFFGEYFFM